MCIQVAQRHAFIHCQSLCVVYKDTMAETSTKHDLWLEHKGLCADELVARALYYLQEYGEPFDILDHDWKAALLDLRLAISTCTSYEEPCIRTLTADVPAGTRVRVQLRAELPPGPAQATPYASEFIWCDGDGRFKTTAPNQRIYPLPADAFLVLGLREQFKSFCTLMRVRGLEPRRSIHDVAVAWEDLPEEWDGAPPAYQCKVLLKVHAHEVRTVQTAMQILHQVANFVITTKELGHVISQHTNTQEQIQKEFEGLKQEAIKDLTKLKNAFAQAAAQMEDDNIDEEKVSPLDAQIGAATLQTEADDGLVDAMNEDAFDMMQQTITSQAAIIEKYKQLLSEERQTAMAATGEDLKSDDWMSDDCSGI